MTDYFREYIESEISCIYNEIDEESKKDPIKRNEKALEWIEKHSKDFRNKWNAAHKRNKLN